MALNFPSSPSTNATYTFNGKTWTYTNNVWTLSTSTLNTSAVVESSNLYFTNARATAAVINTTLSNLTLSGNITVGNVTLSTNGVLTFPDGTRQNTAASGSGSITSVNGRTGVVTGLAETANSLSQFASTTSAQLAGIISDETGSGSLVFASSPTLSGVTATGATLLTTIGMNTTPALRIGDTYNRNINFLANVGAGNYSPIATTDDSLIYFSAGLNTGNLVIAPWGSFNHGIKLNTVGNTIYLYGNVIASSNISAAAGNISGNFTAGNFQTAGNVNSQNELVTGSLTAGTLQTSGQINAGSGTISSGTGRVSFATDAGGSISLGNVSSQGAGTPYIDFNSGATSVDYDTRIQGTGGTGVAGKGTLSFTAATSAFSANVTAGNVTLNTNGVLTFPDGTRQTTASSASGTLLNIITRSANVGIVLQNRTFSVQGRTSNTTITVS